jgi:hypothetical protein
VPANVKEILTAYDAGKYLIRSWRKVPSQATASGIWFDLSMSPGNPAPQYYAAAPLAATVLARSTDGGLDHGPNVSSATKYLRKFLAMTQTATAVPLPIYLLDYLLYYSFITMDVGTQDLTNTNVLTRYTDGAGVRVMAIEVAAQVGGSQFRFTYTNSAGVAGRVSQTVTCNTQVVNGTVITSAPTTNGCAGPFIPLQSGDTGVRSIEQVEFLTGDVGLIALVLVKPLGSASIYDITAPVEVDYLIDQNQMPIIKDDAYLNMIAHPSGTLASAPIQGLIETMWS